MIGININSRTIPFAQLIVDGFKTLESRKTNSLKPYIGKRVAIVQTGKGKALAIGAATIGRPFIVDSKLFRELESRHFVAANSEFDIIEGSIKYLYPLENPEKFDKPLLVEFGIVARQIVGE